MKQKIAAIGAAMIATAVISSAAGAQLLGVLTVERLSILDEPWAGARACGMGGAYTAVSDDPLGVLYNPAGIARASGSDVSLGIYERWQDVEHVYDGAGSAASGSYLSFGHIGAILPYSSYSTDIYFGVGVFRTGGSDLEYVRTGERPDLGGDIRNVLLQDGSVYQYRFAVAGKLSPAVSVGAAFVLWDGNPRFLEEISFQGAADSSYVFSDDVTANLDGVSFDFGVHARLGRLFDAGLVVTTPTWLDYGGDGVERYSGTWPDGSGWTTDPYYFRVDDEITLPMTIRGGAALRTEPLTVSAEATCADYTQTKYNGRTLYHEDDPRIDVLKQVWSYRIGAELRVPRTTLSLRAGYAYQPLPVRGIDEMTYVEETPDEFWLVTDWQLGAVTSERRLFTFGAGIVIDRSLSVDAAVTTGRFERETLYLAETRELTELLVSGSFRF
ncbi:MAG: hypothetical protein PHQ19_00010 [Candidatus Krumholzibacteria bacterium]|nr:hypothetical protein [Candidatus Krumholzibacteria bacterium]